MNFPPHFLVLLFKTAFHLNASTKFALLGLNLFIFWKASISSMILLGFSDFWLSNRLENPVAIYPSMTVFCAIKTLPPTSVEAERAFSASGMFVTKLRSHLSEKTIDALIFRRKNLKSEWFVKKRSVLWSFLKKKLGCYKIITFFVYC